MSEEGNDDGLLEPEKKGLGAFLLPAVLVAAGGAALYASSKKKKSKAEPLEPAKNEVVFSSNYSRYAIGEEYESLVLEPYLADLAESGNLYLRDQGPMQGLDGPLEAAENVYLERSRQEAIAAFRKTHRGKVGAASTLFSSMPPDKTSVQSFFTWLDERVEYFQENY